MPSPPRREDLRQVESRPDEAGEPPSRDYRISHQSLAEASHYEHELYASDSYDAWVSGLESRVLHDIVERSFGGRPFSYLDFACGTGRILADVETRAGSAVGADVSGSMLGFARPKVRRATLVEGDLTRDENLLPGPFDLITAFRFFLNSQPQLRDEAMSALARRLAPNGRLVVNLHGNKLSLWSASYTFRRHVLRRTVPDLSWPELRQMMHRHGLRVVELHGVSLVNRTIYRIAGERRAEWLESAAHRFPRLQRCAIDLIVVCQRRS